MDISSLLTQCAFDVDPNVVAAIIRSESDFQPYSIHINHTNRRLHRQPKDKTEAVQWSQHLIAKGYNIDMGLMQINSKNIKRFNLSIESLFEPCTNISIGTTILIKNYEQAARGAGQGKKALYSAISAYNTGNFISGFNNPYVKSVVKNMYSQSFDIKKEMQNASTLNLRAPVEFSIEKQSNTYLMPYQYESEIQAFKYLHY